MVCSGIDKGIVDCGAFACGLALLSVAFVLFGMKCYLCMRGVWLLLEE